MLCGAVLLALTIILTIVLVVTQSRKSDELVTAKNGEKSKSETKTTQEKGEMLEESPEKEQKHENLKEQGLKEQNDKKISKISPIKNILDDKQKPSLSISQSNQVSSTNDLPVKTSAAGILQSNPPSVAKNSLTKESLTAPASNPQGNSLFISNDLLKNTPPACNPPSNTLSLEKNSSEETISEHPTPNISQSNLHSNVTVKNSDLTSPISESSLSLQVSDELEKNNDKQQSLSDSSTNSFSMLSLEIDIPEGEINRDQPTNSYSDTNSYLSGSWELIDDSNVNVTHSNSEDNKNNTNELQLGNESKNVANQEQDESNSGEISPLSPLKKKTDFDQYLISGLSNTQGNAFATQSGKVQNNHNSDQASRIQHHKQFSSSKMNPNAQEFYPGNRASTDTLSGGESEQKMTIKV